MKLDVFVNGPMLVQFASSFGVLHGWHLKIAGSAPRISQARMAARGQAGRIKPFDNMSLESLILLRCEEY